MSRRVDAIVLQNLLSLRLAGLTPAEIGEALGISQVAAAIRLDREGIGISELVSRRSSVRDCICCKKPFISSGPGHRMCSPCRSESI